LGLAATVVFVSILGFLFILMEKKHIGVRLVERGVGLVSSYIAHRAREYVDLFLSGLAIVNYRYKHKKDILMVILFSVLVWFVEGMTYYVVSLSFGFNLPLYVSLFTVVIVNLGIMIPSAPGYIATFEFFCISALALFSVEKSVALSFAIVLHIVLFVPITLIGMLYFWKENVRFAEIRIKEITP